MLELLAYLGALLVVVLVLGGYSYQLRQDVQKEQARVNELFDRLASRDYPEYAAAKRFIGEWDPDKDEPGRPAGRMIYDSTGIIETLIPEDEDA